MGLIKRIYQALTQSRWLPFFLIALVVSLSYFDSLENEFVWDDEFLIEKNTFLRGFEHLPTMLISNSTAGFGGQDNFYRPTQNIYYLFIFKAFGYNKVAFHLGNILVHFLNGLLIFFLVFRLFKRKDLAILTSLFWVAHPTHVEAVTYISGTADPLSFFFCLLSLLSFPYFQKNIKKHLFSLLFFLLALMSKEAIIVTPALLMICLFYLEEKRPLYWRTYIKTIPFWVLAFGYLIVREVFLNFDQTFSFYKTTNIYTENIQYRLFTFLATLPEYIVILFRPIQLHMERSFPVFINFMSWPVLLGSLLVTVPLILGVFKYLKQGNKLALFCWLWFFAAFVPMTGVLIPVNSFILEHWLYVPSLTLFLAFGFFILWTGKWQKWLPFVLGLLVISAEIYFTHERNKDWRTPISFYQDILRYSEGSARVHNNLAMAYQDKELSALAIEHYKKSISLSDTYPQTHYNLARAYIKENKLDLALEHLNRSLELKPDFQYSLKLKKDLLEFLNRKSSSN